MEQPSKKQTIQSSNNNTESSPLEQSQFEPVEPQEVKNHLQKTYGLAPDSIENMLILLKTTLIDEFNKAENFLSNNDWSSLSKTGHAMKGALRNAGVDTWAEIAFSIEKQELSEGKDLKKEMTIMLQDLKNGLQLLIS